MLLDIEGKEVEVIPIKDFDFPSEQNVGELFQLTCKNHPTARYSTKNPYCRGLHFLEGPKEHPFTECACSFNDLVVVPKN